MTGPDPRETRLPKWAQSDLRRLRGEVDRLSRLMADSNDATVPGLRINDGLGSGRDVAPDSRVEWTFGGDDHRAIEVARTEDHKRGEVLILRSRHGRLVTFGTGGVNCLLVAEEPW